jgi:hypothetical protein
VPLAFFHQKRETKMRKRKSPDRIIKRFLRRSDYLSLDEMLTRYGVTRDQLRRWRSAKPRFPGSIEVTGGRQGRYYAQFAALIRWEVAMLRKSRLRGDSRI